MSRVNLFFIAIFFSLSLLSAEVRLPNVLGDGMVLQGGSLSMFGAGLRRVKKLSLFLIARRSRSRRIRMASGY